MAAIAPIEPATTASSGPIKVAIASSGSKKQKEAARHIVSMPLRAFKEPPVTIVIKKGQRIVSGANCNEV